MLEGKRRNPINLSVIGNVGEHFANWAKECRLVVEGDAGDYCGSGSLKSNFHMKGGVGDYFADTTRECGLIVEGDTRDYCGSGSLKSNFHMKGGVGGHLGNHSIACFFRVEGNVGTLFGYSSKYSTFYFHKGVDFSHYSDPSRLEWEEQIPPMDGIFYVNSKKAYGALTNLARYWKIRDHDNIVKLMEK